MLNIIMWLLFGALSGIIASRLMKERNGLLSNIVVGIIGSFLAGLAMSGFKSLNTTNISLTGLLASILGGIVFIAFLNLLRTKKN